MAHINTQQPGFMRTDMTKGVGYDKFWDVGGGKLHCLNLLRYRALSCYFSGPTLGCRKIYRRIHIIVKHPANRDVLGSKRTKVNNVASSPRLYY